MRLTGNKQKLNS